MFKRRDAAVRDAVEWVRLNACKGIAPADVIACIGGSRRSAEMRFRDFSGRSIGEEITAVRLERAKELLSMPLVPIDSIYAECGYADPTSLRKAFRKAFSQSPREWRLAHLA
jgi:transcriptional regulator GlxA family with amidase domain